MKKWIGKEEMKRLHAPRKYSVILRFSQGVMGFLGIPRSSQMEYGKGELIEDLQNRRARETSRAPPRDAHALLWLCGSPPRERKPWMCLGFHKDRPIFGRPDRTETVGP